jgi:hypothetical protein
MTNGEKGDKLIRIKAVSGAGVFGVRAGTFYGKRGT